METKETKEIKELLDDLEKIGKVADVIIQYYEHSNMFKIKSGNITAEARAFRDALFLFVSNYKRIVREI